MTEPRMKINRIRSLTLQLNSMGISGFSDRLTLRVLKSGGALLVLLAMMSSCGVYSFTGASISPDVKTISIMHFPNQAPLVQPTLSQVFTEALKDKFTSQTNLTMVDRGGHLHLEGAIVSYSTQPVAIQSGDQAALNRLTIGVKVTFINEKDEKQNFEQTFSRYYDYDSRLSLQVVEPEAIKAITDALVEDIFNKAVVNW